MHKALRAAGAQQFQGALHRGGFFGGLNGSSRCSTHRGVCLPSAAFSPCNEPKPPCCFSSDSEQRHLSVEMEGRQTRCRRWKDPRGRRGSDGAVGDPWKVLGSETLSLQELLGFLPFSKQQFPLQRDLAHRYRPDKLMLVTESGFSPLHVRKLRHRVTRRAGTEEEQPGPVSHHTHRPPSPQPRTWWSYILPLPAFSAAAWAPPGPAAPGAAAWDLPRCQTDSPAFVSHPSLLCGTIISSANTEDPAKLRRSRHRSGEKHRLTLRAAPAPSKTLFNSTSLDPN